MRTGIGVDDKERGLMTAVAWARFRKFSDEGIAGLYAYLPARAHARH